MVSSRSITVVSRLNESEFNSAFKNMSFSERLATSNKEKASMKRRYAIPKFKKYAKMNPFPDYDIQLMEWVTRNGYGIEIDRYYSIIYCKI